MPDELNSEITSLNEEGAPEKPKQPLFQLIKTKINTYKVWIKTHPKKAILLGGILLILFSASVVVVAANLKEKETYKNRILKTVEVDRFLLIKTDPFDLAPNVPLNKKITFFFNQEVNAHSFESSFFIEPEVKGTFTKGKTNQEVVFTPLTDYQVGTTYQVTVSSNLRSMSGNFLNRDYFLRFTVDVVGNKVVFLENGLSNRFMSFPKNKEVTLSLEKGTTVEGAITVNVYQSDVEPLLESLVYQDKIVTYTGGSYTIDEFKEKTVDATTMKKLDTFNNLEDKGKIKVKKDIGVYYLEAVNNKNERLGQSWLSFNNTGLLLKQDDQKVYLASQDLFTGETGLGIEVSLYNLKNQVSLLTKDKIDEKKEINLLYPAKLDIVVGRVGSDIIVIPVSVPESQADLRVYQDLSKRNQLFLYTDRPIYKKGDTVYYRGVLRRDQDALYKLPAKGEVIRVYATKYANEKTVNILDQKVAVDANGVFSGQFIANDNFIGDYQTLYATVNGEQSENTYSGITYFDVKSYSKPTFDISVKVEKTEIFLGDKVNATITAKNNNGTPLVNQEISYGFTSNSYFETDKAVFNKNFNLGQWGGMCGGGFGINDVFIDQVTEGAKKIKTDSNGKALITIDTSEIEDKTSKTVTIMAFKVDDKGNKVFGADNTIARQGDINVFIRQRRSTYFVGEETFAQFYSENGNGEKQANKEFNYEITQTNYNSETNKTTEETLLVGTTSTNNNGIGLVKRVLNLKEGSYNIKVIGTDSAGRKVSDSIYIYVYQKTSENESYYGLNFWGDPEKVYLDVLAEKNSYKVGEKATLKINSPSDVKTLVTFERGRVYQYDWVDLKKGENEYDIDITENLSPSFAIVFSYFKDGNYISEGLSLNVPAMHKLINVEIKADKDKYAPNEKARLTITTKNNSGQPISAKISLGVVDKAIYILRKDANESIHSSFYYYRPRSTNASSSLTRIGSYGGGGGGGGGGGTLADKLVDTLYWNPNIQTDNSGVAQVDVQLNTYETTWRATVYASTDSSEVGQELLDFTVAK